MTAEQFVSDLDALVDAVRERLSMDRIGIFGHSWGSVLGVLYAARFPEKVLAYVGCGQLGDWPAAESGSYAWALSEAERRGSRRAGSKLRAIGPPPYPPKAGLHRAHVGYALRGPDASSSRVEAGPSCAQPPRRGLRVNELRKQSGDIFGRRHLCDLIPECEGLRTECALGEQSAD
jgi:pimeloyl-ACP methyl ester carboxylesterase